MTIILDGWSTKSKFLKSARRQVGSQVIHDGTMQIHALIP